MREIIVYEMLPEHISGSSENYLNLKEKIDKDRLILADITLDYEKDAARYKEEYKAAYKNFLINQFLYGWSFLHMHDGKAVLSDAFQYSHICRSIEIPDDPKEELKRRGWMIPPSIMNTRITTSRNMTTEELYIDHFDAFFDDYFNLSIGDEGSRIDRYYKQAVANYKNKCYYACAVSLFPIIESYHKYINDYDDNKIYRIKKSLGDVKDKVLGLRKTIECGVKYYTKLIEQFNELAKKHYFNISTDMNDEPEIINRNRIVHGIFSREIDKKDCLQLFCVITNLVFIKQLIEANKMMDDAEEKLKQLRAEET